jgi:hypothetical protein
MQITRWASCAALLAAAGPAAAHVTLSETAAPAGSMYVAHFRVGHGCGGAATTALRIEIPLEVTGAKPQPKPGWTLQIDHAPPAAGARGAGRVTAITWTGGPLPDDEWDEFGISAKLPARTGPLSFPVVQSCEGVQVHWVGRSSDGEERGHGSHPAPTITLTRPAAGGSGP